MLTIFDQINALILLYYVILVCMNIHAFTEISLLRIKAGRGIFDFFDETSHIFKEKIVHVFFVHVP